MGDTQRLNPFKPGSSEIVSENNPRFRDVARRLAQLQRSSGVAPIPTPQFKQPFAPSYMALERKGLAEQPPRNPNSNYLGHSAKQDRPKVPDYLNCGLWLYGLHPETTVEDLLGENGANQNRRCVRLEPRTSSKRLPNSGCQSLLYEALRCCIVPGASM